MCRHRSGWARCDQNINWIGCKSAPLHADVRSHLSGSSIRQLLVACENIRFPPLFAAGDLSRGGRRRHEKLDKFIFGTAWLPDLLCKHWCASSVWNFCSWVADVPPHETSKAAKSQEKRMFSQAELLACWHRVFFVLRAEPPRRGHHRGCPLTPSEHFAILSTKH